MENHIGTSLESFLEDEGIKEEVTISAITEFVLSSLLERIDSQELSERDIAVALNISFRSVRRLLAMDQPFPFGKILLAAKLIGREIKVELL